MALVGAYVLAGEMSTARGDYPSAFSRYQAKMRDYVSRNQRLAAGGARGFVPKSRLRKVLRNLYVRALPCLPASTATDGAAQRASRAIALDDYDR